MKHSLLKPDSALPETIFLVGEFESAEFVEQIQSVHPPFDLIAIRYVIHELCDPIETFRLWKQLLQPAAAAFSSRLCQSHYF